MLDLRVRLTLVWESREVALTGTADVLIKDANADLNVYVETTEDGTRRAKNGEQKKSGCCAPTATVAQACCTAAVTAGDACCSPEKKASGCCAPKAENPGCCAPVEMAGDRLDLKSMAAELADVDLNELVGRYSLLCLQAS